MEWFGMVASLNDDQAGLAALRNFLSEQKLALNDRLPAERQLCGEVGLTRSKLRKALALLEAEGLIWRHVGRGTFIGPRPVINLTDVKYLTNQTSPTEMMEARMAVEPQLARLASLHATVSNFTEIRRCNRRCRGAREWRVYEAWDNNFHQAIAAATHNKLLISLFDTLNIVRRSTVWGQLRSTTLPPANHDSFAEHDAIYDAIARRDPDSAADCMRIHLRTVRNRILASLDS
jgi:GntR family uxuAB operon transcriptional repressor